MKENLRFAIQSLEDAFLRLKEGIEKLKRKIQNDY